MIASVFSPSRTERMTSACPGRSLSRLKTLRSVCFNFVNSRVTLGTRALIISSRLHSFQTFTTGLETVASVVPARMSNHSNNVMDDEALKQLARIPQLRELRMNQYPGGVTDRGLEVLQHLPELRVFEICWQSGITDKGISYLRRCEQLEEVDLPRHSHWRRCDCGAHGKAKPAKVKDRP